jgi:hypothetical protein
MIVDKASEVAIGGGVGVAMTSGGALYLGLTSAQWSAVGVVGGLLVAVVGLIVKTVVDIYFKQQHLKIVQARAEALAGLIDED